MNRISPRRAAECLLGLALLAGLAQAAGFDDFKLARAIPADAMIAVNVRDHDGMAFLNAQFERVWAEVEKQKFDRDIRRIFLTNVKQQGGDPNAFEAQWQQITDLAAGVEWAGLAKREFAFAMKLAPPIGAEWALMFMPAADKVEGNFTSLAALAKGLAALGGESVNFVQEGEGASRLCKITFVGAPGGLGLTLAREKDVIVFGLGASLPEQALALLRGDSEPSASLPATDRFKAAFKELPAPKDSFSFIDIGRLMAQTKVFAEMLNAMVPATQSATQPAQPPMAWVGAMIDEMDVWDFYAEVASTNDKRTETNGITVLRAKALDTTFGRTFYSNPPLKDPLKLVPKLATTVSANSGFNWRALYEGAIKFIREKAPDGESAIAQWEAMKSTLPIDIEKDILPWLGGQYVTYSAPHPTPFNPGSVVILPAADTTSLTTFIDKTSTLLNTALVDQNGGVEDANMPGVTGFKRVILPPMFMMIPGIGRPIYGVKDGNLWVANGPEIVAAGLAVADGSAENFEKNERYAEEGLPIKGPVTAFAFNDLTTLGEQLSQMFAMAGMIPAMGAQLGPIAKDPVFINVMTMISKIGNVVKKLDFFKSSCTIKTFEKGVERATTVTHYQEPPKPKTSKPATTPTEEPAKPAAEEKKP